MGLYIGIMLRPLLKSLYCIHVLLAEAFGGDGGSAATLGGDGDLGGLRLSVSKRFLQGSEPVALTKLI